MPNRILKESICSSETIDSLNLFHEIFFYRLLVNCDDYGRMDGRPKILKSKLFPLKDMDSTDIICAVKELERVGLIYHYMVDGKPYIQVRSWDEHQQIRAKKSKYPSPDDVIGNQSISDDYKCPRNPIQSESEYMSESESESEYMSADEAKKIQSEQDRVLTAAEDAGFKMSNTVRAQLIALFAEYGMDKMLSGINECATHSAVSLAYLRAVLNGNGKRASPKNSFPQRDYKMTDEKLLSDLAKEMDAFMKEGG